MRWTDVVLDGTDRPGAAGSNSTLSVKHFEKGQYRAGLVQSSDLIQEGDVFGTARSVARSFPEGVSVQIDDRHLESSPAGQDHSSPEPAPVGPTHVPMREVGPDELGSEQMAPSEIFNPGFGRPWDGPDSPYRPLDESEVEDLFDSTLGTDSRATAERLGLDDGGLSAFAYLAPESCHGDPGDLRTCERFVSVAETETGIPLEVQSYDYSGNLMTLYATHAEFGNE
jgi:hypothetical protein